jgi:hypothetical protein
MKTTKVNSVLALSAVAILSLTSCQKKELAPANVGSGSATTTQNGGTLSKPTYDEGIRSVTNLTSGANASIGYVQLVVSSYVNNGASSRTFGLGGDAINATTAKCYGAAAGIEAVVYNGADGYARISVNSGLGGSAAAGTNSIGGSGAVILIAGATPTTLRFEEIEINPADGQAYGIVKNGNQIQLYRIATDGSGTATVITYNGNAEIFHNPNGNGYKSGSICFVETPVNSGTYELAFANESTVYSTLGIVVWRYSIMGNTVVVNGPHNATYAPSLIPGAQTGKINTASVRGQLFFARDNSQMYQLNGTNSVTPIAITPSNTANSNDFGYYKTF